MLKLQIQLFAEPEDEPTPEEAQLKKIEELKIQLEQSVSKEEYDKIKKEYSRLLDEYVNKRPQPKVVELEDASVYAKKLLKNEPMSNRKFIENSLLYRQSMLSQTGHDPWSDKGEPTSETTRVAELLQTVLDESSNDQEFRYKLDQLLRDDPRIITVINAKRSENRKNKK